MRDAIVLSDLAFDAANHLREMFNKVGSMKGHASFSALTEDQLVTACVFFMDMMMRNPMTERSPETMGTMLAAILLATNEGIVNDADQLERWSDALNDRYEGDGDGTEE